jgi:hypothetical protein
MFADLSLLQLVTRYLAPLPMRSELRNEFPESGEKSSRRRLSADL